MLFSGPRVMFYVCTHEKFGQVIGPASLLNALALSPLAQPLQDTWAICGDPLPSGVLERILTNSDD
jgi:hypothetical protein